MADLKRKAGLLFKWASGLPVAKCVITVKHALPRLETLPQRWVVAKWRFLAFAVARGTKVGAALHRLLRVLHAGVRPYAGMYFGGLVLDLLFELGFKVFVLTLRISQLHSKFLDLEFEAVQRLHLGKAHG